jgi:hypothetical protein
VPLLAHGGEFVLSADVVEAIKRGGPTLGLGASAAAFGRGLAGIDAMSAIGGRTSTVGAGAYSTGGQTTIAPRFDFKGLPPEVAFKMAMHDLASMIPNRSGGGR